MLVGAAGARPETDRVLQIAASPRLDAEVADRQLLTRVVIGKNLCRRIVALPHLQPHPFRELLVRDIETFGAQVRVALNDHPQGACPSGGRRQSAEHDGGQDKVSQAMEFHRNPSTSKAGVSRAGAA
jgi:hypothetical protein